MEGVEDKLDYLMLIDQKRHKELLAEIKALNVTPVVKVQLAEVVKENARIIEKVKQLILSNSPESKLQDLTSAIKENNKMMMQLVSDMQPKEKRNFTFDIVRNKITGFIEHVNVTEN